MTWRTLQSLLAVLAVLWVSPVTRAGRTPTGIKDSAPMVLVPAGRFLRGSNVEGAAEKPARHIHLDAFFIDKHEVTVAQYERCVKAKRCSSAVGSEINAVQRHVSNPTVSKLCNWGKMGRRDHPLNCVSWHQAKTYCSWAGKRLPTEAEWEKAARGIDGRRYPWGNQEANCRRAVMWGPGHGCGKKLTWPVGSKSPAGDSPYAIQDMGGNVWEWTADWYVKSYYRSSTARNPIGPPAGTYGTVVLRGGGLSDHARILLVTTRHDLPPRYRLWDIGFRCAKSANFPPREHPKANKTK